MSKYEITIQNELCTQETNGEEIERPIQIRVEGYAGKKKPLEISLSEEEAVNLKDLLVSECVSGSLKEMDELAGKLRYYVEDVNNVRRVIRGYESFIKIAKPCTSSASRVYLPYRLTGRAMRIIVTDPPLDEFDELPPNLDALDEDGIDKESSCCEK